MTSITVVTPWLNARELIPGYARAMELAQGGPEEDSVIVVDAGSSPPLDAKKDFQAGGIALLQASGYVEANNLGLRHAETDAVLFLNNDVQAQAPWLDPIRAALAPGRLVGTALLSPPYARVQGRPVAYLDGWCLAGMRDDLLELGGFDEAFEEPAYFSDNDLCLRAKVAGFKLVAIPVPLTHIGNYTSRLDVERRNKASQANRERYLKKAEELLCLSQ